VLLINKSTLESKSVSDTYHTQGKKTSRVRSQFQKSGVNIEDTSSQFKSPNTSKIVSDIRTLEDKLEKHEIDIAMTSKHLQTDSDENIDQIRDKLNFLKKILSELESKIQTSELGFTRASTGKSKQSGESKVFNSIYLLMKRLFEGQITIFKSAEDHYKAVVENKDYLIDNLDTRLKTSMAHLKRIEQDRITLKIDVDQELKKLDDMGRFDNIEKPDYLIQGFPRKSPEEDASFALTDIYQFLLFEGEIAKSDPFLKNVQTDYTALKSTLFEKLSLIQKTTAEQVVRRIWKKSDPVDKGMQTLRDPIMDDIEMLRDKELDLYRKKYDLEEENKKLKSEIILLKSKTTEAEKLLQDFTIENRLFKEQVKSLSATSNYSKRDSDMLAKVNQKLVHLQAMLDKRNQHITRLLEDKKQIKEEMDRIISQFNDILDNTKVMKGEIRLKESIVKKLK
jgi:hypothetical protein